ncbi:hypothetical protein Barb7_02777 [Bacteroidales bacterium Barb7]|nr:hypothetical protein Barb7_02777 [Bacteroidales bacterium Barb7]
MGAWEKRLIAWEKRLRAWEIKTGTSYLFLMPSYLILTTAYLIHILKGQKISALHTAQRNAGLLAVSP